MKILITGAAGRIGTIYRKHLGDAHPLRLHDRKPIADPGPHETLIGGLEDLETARTACQGIDTVIHLAADPNNRGEFYQSLHTNNFVATYNLYTAAHEAGCKRVIFASSVHATTGLSTDRRQVTEDEHCPGNVYGVSKSFGESLANYFAHVQGMSSICFRFGAVCPPLEFLRKAPAWERDVYLGPRDLCQLLDRAVSTDVHYAVLNASSDNANNRFDLTRTRQVLGYRPEDRLEDLPL